MTLLFRSSGIITAITPQNLGVHRIFESINGKQLAFLNYPCSDCVRQFIRKRSNLSRTATDVYYPSNAHELKRNESLKRLPKKIVVKPEAAPVTDDEHRSTKLFKDVMGEIYTTKSKRLISIEGVKMIEDAVKFGLNFKYLFILKAFKFSSDLVKEIVEDAAGAKTSNGYGIFKNKVQPEVHHISLKALQEWSALTTPPGIVGVFEKPTENYKASCISKKPPNVPLTLILDNIREPGNLGSIMRTAAGIGCKIILSQGCTDPWNTKTLRGANGAHFLVPMTTKVDLSHLHQYIPLEDLGSCENENMLSTEEGETTTLISNDYHPRGTGIGVFLADGGTGDDKFGIPIVPYTSIDYASLKSVYLCVGGETHGLSSTLRKAVTDLKSFYPDDIKIVSRLTIPMHYPIDSLNAANALGIIGYEIARQFVKR